jgi:hypothetical protein
MFQTPNQDPAPDRPSRPCSVCDTTTGGDEYMAWGSAMCPACFRAWSADKGVRDASALNFMADTAAAYRAATAAFIAARRKAAPA